MPARGIQHVDLCVSDVDRSLAFYMELLGPLGLEEDIRAKSYRGTEEIVYLKFGEQNLGLRPADGGEHRYYGVGIEHLAFEVETREEVDAAFERCQALGAQIHFPPEVDHGLTGTTTRSSSGTRTASASKSSAPRPPRPARAVGRRKRPRKSPANRLRPKPTLLSGTPIYGVPK